MVQFAGVWSWQCYCSLAGMIALSSLVHLLYRKRVCAPYTFAAPGCLHAFLALLLKLQGVIASCTAATHSGAGLCFIHYCSSPGSEHFSGNMLNIWFKRAHRSAKCCICTGSVLLFSYHAHVLCITPDKRVIVFALLQRTRQQTYGVSWTASFQEQW